MRFVLFVCFLMFAVYTSQSNEHTKEGTHYGKQGVDIYAKMRHGPDGALFLDPYFMPYLSNLDGQILLDAGCGSGPWSICAAKNGACVYGIDIQSGMIAKATQAALEEGVEKSVEFQVGDVNHLPYPDHFFDRALSINVGCNLSSLKVHLEELNRVLKRGGIAIITAPNSFGVVFTEGKKAHADVLSSIDALLAKNPNEVPKILQNLDGVYRATFAKKQGIWSLVCDESTLTSGEEIWRKIPMMVVPNYYHPVAEYQSLITALPFRIRHMYQPHFADEHAREEYNKNQQSTPASTLGAEYIGYPPFVIFVIEKPL